MTVFKMALYISSILHTNPPPTTLRSLYILFHSQTTNFVESSSIKWNWSWIKKFKISPFFTYLSFMVLIYLRQASSKTRKSHFMRGWRIRLQTRHCIEICFYSITLSDNVYSLDPYSIHSNSRWFWNHILKSSL